MKMRVTCSRSEAAESDRILRQSSVLKEFKKEKQEINKLKWLESEKSGKDIGYEQALFMWARRHRTPWRAERRKRLLEKRK